MTKEEIEIIIDNLHIKANQDIKNKNIDEYMSIFDDDLKYTQLNGKTINKNRLIQDQKKYWSCILEINNNYERLDCHLDNDLFIENLTQIATVWVRSFVFFRKKWTFRRKGKYVWRHINGQWRICQVNILEEKIN